MDAVLSGGGGLICSFRLRPAPPRPVPGLVLARPGFVPDSRRLAPLVGDVSCVGTTRLANPRPGDFGLPRPGGDLLPTTLRRPRPGDVAGDWPRPFTVARRVQGLAAAVIRPAAVAVFGFDTRRGDDC